MVLSAGNCPSRTEGSQYKRRRGQDRDQGLLSHVNRLSEDYTGGGLVCSTPMSCSATKPLEALLKDAGHESLRRTLGPTQLVALESAPLSARDCFR